MSLCPFSEKDGQCVQDKCQLWDRDYLRCAIWSIATNLAKINDNIIRVTDKMILKAH